MREQRGELLGGTEAAATARSTSQRIGHEGFSPRGSWLRLIGLAALVLSVVSPRASGEILAGMSTFVDTYATVWPFLEDSSDLPPGLQKWGDWGIYHR